MNLWDMVMLKLKETFNIHKADTSAHHARYTDAEVDTIVAAHTAIVDAHHARYTDAEVDTIVAAHTAITAAHHARYTDAEVDTIVAAHTAITAAHHARYTDAEVDTIVAAHTAVYYAHENVSGNTFITPAGGITVTHHTMRIVAPYGTTTDITANPQIAAGVDGQIVLLQGCHDTYYVIIDDGDGVITSGGVSRTIKDNDILTLIYDSGESAWIEISFSDNHA